MHKLTDANNAWSISPGPYLAFASPASGSKFPAPTTPAWTETLQEERLYCQGSSIECEKRIYVARCESVASWRSLGEPWTSYPPISVCLTSPFEMIPDRIPKTLVQLSVGIYSKYFQSWFNKFSAVVLSDTDRCSYLVVQPRKQPMSQPRISRLAHSQNSQIPSRSRFGTVNTHLSTAKIFKRDAYN